MGDMLIVENAKTEVVLEILELIKNIRIGSMTIESMHRKSMQAELLIAITEKYKDYL